MPSCTWAEQPLQGGGLGKQRPSPDSAALPPPPRAICSILRTWLDKYPEDFCQSMDLACLNQLMAYVLLNMPCSELAVPVDLLLTQLEDHKSSEVEPKGEEALGKCPRGCEDDISSSGKSLQRKQFRVPSNPRPCLSAHLTASPPAHPLHHGLKSLPNNFPKSFLKM